jgi:hypothetical protein
MKPKIVALSNDPNYENIVKKSTIYMFRELVRTQPEMQVIDYNEPNDNVLWLNIKNKFFKPASEEHLQRERDYYINKKKVPEWLPDYAGDMGFADAMINTYETGLFYLIPGYVLTAKKDVIRARIKADEIYPDWWKMRHLLTAQDRKKLPEKVEKLADELGCIPPRFLQGK